MLSGVLPQTRTTATSDSKPGLREQVGLCYVVGEKERHMDFYIGDYVKNTSTDGEGWVYDVIYSGSDQKIKVNWKYGDTSSWRPSRDYRLIKRGKQYIKSLRIGDDVLVRGATYPEATIIQVSGDEVRVAYRSNKVEAWHSVNVIERNTKPVLPNTVGSQIVVHKHVWTLLPKYLTWLNGTFVPGVAEEDLLWIYTPNDEEQSLEYIKQHDISRFTWTLIRDARKA